MRGSLWAWPALEVVHIAGIALLVGSLVVLELRVLGLARALPLPALARLALPVSLAGFGLAAASGLLMFAADTDTLLVHPAFRAKMLLLMAAGLNAALFHARGGLVRVDATARLQVAGSLLLWLAVIVAGRLIAYI
ncbi:hypothetical protein E6O51_08120 [Pseudothauera rhizosphaerae]|uniref:Copper resistance protein D n=1 Tax=Pseudothauera rhizosphaerae TaxID=2565932 RepID=A0A4V3WB82_9RHOO|nr:hypothetical protein E6O51_08120 [Pseudothauera rhizosphaerae]